MTRPPAASPAGATRLPARLLPQAPVSTPARVPAQPRPPVDLELPDHGLSALVTTQDRIPETSREGTERVHISALLGDWCARRHAIHYRHPESMQQQESPSPADRLLWAIGKAVEKHIRTQLIISKGPEKCLGHWHCPCPVKTTRVGFGMTKPPVCPGCCSPLNIYAELHLLPDAWPVTGSSDFIYSYGRKVLEVVEIKSKKLKDFEELTEPEANHVLQASGYRALLVKACPPGFTVSPRVRVMYGAKDYPRPGALVYKDFVRPFREDVPPSLDRVEADLGAILRGDTKARLPARLTACSSSGVPRARKCSACALCFSLK